MTREPDEPHPAHVTQLFEEYIALREGDAAGDVDGLFERAGEDAENLRERIHVYGLLHELGDLIADDVEGTDEPADEPAPERLGRFEIVRPIGEGGLSRVYLAWDSLLERELAIKVMRSTSSGAGRESWILSEGKKLARLEHDSIVRVIDVGEYEGRAYVAMEYVAGPTLAEVLDALRAGSDGEQPEKGSRDAIAREAAERLRTAADRTTFVLNIARALDYCHEHGIIHRDIKPGNVLIDASGTPKLIDFGLAKLDADESLFVTDRLIGTPAYLSPEQVDNERTGASIASDQFSLGVLLYELLTLENPFVRESRSETLTAISRAWAQAPRRLDSDIPLDLERICLHCLERSPERRYASISDLVRDLEAFLSYRAISLKAPSFVRQVGLFARRYKSQVTVASVALATVAVVLTAASIASARSSRADLLDRIATQRDIVDSYQRPDELAGAFEELGKIRSTAEGYDSALFSGLLWPSVTPALDDTWTAGAERLNDELTAVFARADSVISYKWRVDHYEAANVLWRKTIFFLDLSSPGVDHGIPFLPVGSIEAPENGRLEYYKPRTFPGLPELVEVEGDTYPASMYRYTERTAGHVLQTEFWLNSLMPRHTVEVFPMSEATRQQLIDVEGTRHTLEGPQGPTEYTIDPFRISRAPVTWAQAIEVLADEQNWIVRYRDRLGTLVETEPARLRWCDANEYARRVGGRLPTPLELWCATQAGAIVPPTEGLDGGIGCDREWISTRIELDRRFAVQYAHMSASPPVPTAWGGDAQFDTDTHPRICFRVAISR